MMKMQVWVAAVVGSAIGMAAGIMLAPLVDTTAVKNIIRKGGKQVARNVEDMADMM